jgi:hypothetical protein
MPYFDLRFPGGKREVELLAPRRDEHGAPRAMQHVAFLD